MVERWHETGTRPAKHGFVEDHGVDQEHSCLPFQHRPSSPFEARSAPSSFQRTTTTLWAVIGRNLMTRWCSTSSPGFSPWAPPCALVADTAGSAATVRRRRAKWMIDAGAIATLERWCLKGYQKMIGLKLGTLAVDGCITTAPCGG